MLTLPQQQISIKDDLSKHPHLDFQEGVPPRQYAIPAERGSSEHNRKRSAGLSYVEHEMLRQRKTPHGRMFEQDNATLDKNVQIPASKHVLLSSFPDIQGARPDERLDQSRAFRRPSYPSSGGLARRNSSIGGQINYISTETYTDRPAWDFPGGLDSMLNQTLPLQPSHRYYLQHGSKIPTVLPSALQSHWGPTASAGQELFGPYWPDGTYQAYRPASTRDSRFFDRGRLASFAGRSSVSNVFEVPTLRRPGKLPDLYPGTVGHRTPALDPSSQSTHVDLGFPSYNTQREQLPHKSTVPSAFFNSDQIFPSDARANAYPHILPESTPPRLRPGQESDNVAFRDRTFAWANRIYSELLTSIQRQNKEIQASYPGDGPRPIPKPAIYPKPPKRSGSHFSDIAAHQATESRPEQPSVQKHWNTTGVLDDPPRPPTAIYSSNRRASEQHYRGPDTAHRSVLSFPPAQDGRSTRDGRRISDSTTYQSQPFQTGSGPYDAAATAFSTMELLCEEAKTSWVDGMLLAGCLAYGLAHYARALHWYQTILHQDPSHVEAMSNLAATLHALNRRDEALTYWSAAVRLRPSYFEAVEHLIGLLCASRRAKEAVNIIEFVEMSLRTKKAEDVASGSTELVSDAESDTRSRSSIASTSSTDHPHYDYDEDSRVSTSTFPFDPPGPGFGSSGYSIPGIDNGRMLALIHAKGNMLYTLNNNSGAAAAFEDAILIATGQRRQGIKGLIGDILYACLHDMLDQYTLRSKLESKDPILLAPGVAQMTAKKMFPPSGELPGLEFVAKGIAQKAAISTTSNCLLSLAKIYQDAMTNATELGALRSTSTRDILALYYLSLSLQRSPSTANNVGILLAGVQQAAHVVQDPDPAGQQPHKVQGVVPGSGIDLALDYYNYGLNLDRKHAHLYTNLGSLLKDMNQLPSAIKMYEMAVQCDGNFDIALANLANAVKDQGRVADAISYYRRAVQSNPDFAEAVCGLATALNSVCSWHGRGGVYADYGRRDRIHVNERGMMHEAGRPYGWINRVVEIVQKQLKEGESWGVGTLTPTTSFMLSQQLTAHRLDDRSMLEHALRHSFEEWSGKKWEGSRIVRLIERAIRQIGWQWYQDRYKHHEEYPARKYARPLLPGSLSSPAAPTVLPFHTFTAPLSAKQVRQISQRNALRISVSTLRSSWLPTTVYPPPRPPKPCLIVGYVSSDFNNHPLAHLMQSVFGLHDPTSVRAICYATTPSDHSIHRAQIEREAPVFHDASSWSVEHLVNQVVADGVHILVNLNGYTRGARNEVFAARPAPIHMSFMGFAGTLGAEWCDYVLADSISVPPTTLSPWRRNVDIEDRLRPDVQCEDEEDWVYSENIIFTKSTFFCVDHKQSAPGAELGAPPGLHDPVDREQRWHTELSRRWKLRQELFPTLSPQAVILGNFNQLYKIDPATFRLYLRILAAVPNSILWLLRFPDLGEQNLVSFARDWAGAEVASRVIFTDVAAKGMHITRASVVDLFLDTPECNAHTTAADVAWSGTPIVTWGKWEYKMCSRMAGSIVASALPEGKEGDEARRELLVKDEEAYEETAIRLARGLSYEGSSNSSSSSSGKDRNEQKQKITGRGRGRLLDLRRMLWEGRWESRLFDTKRWVRDLERAYWEAWTRWESGQGGDIWL